MDGAPVSETRFSLLEQEVTGIKSDLSEFRAEVRSYFSRSSLRSMWPVILGVCGGLWFVLNLQINSTTKNVDDKANTALSAIRSLEAMVTRNNEAIPVLQQQNADSKRDREDKGVVLTKMTDVLAEVSKMLASEVAERRSNEAEFETQIDAMNQSLSVQFANQQRMNADFQNTFHDLGAKMPAAPSGPWFFPNISNRNHRK